MSLDKTLQDIRKQYGEGAIKKLSDFINIERISTPSPGLSYITGGGIPIGRITEFFGREGGGKTTTLLHFVAQAQKLGRVAIVDVEHAIDPEWAEINGVDLNELDIAQPDSGEEAWDIVQKLIEGGNHTLVGLDSIAGIVPLREVEGEMGDTQVGRQAMLNTQAIRRITPVLGQSNCALLWTNQIRAKIGGFGPAKTDTPGGWSAKHAPSIRIEIARKSNIKAKDEVVAVRSIFKCKKNKTGPPFRECEIEIGHGVGLDIVGEAVDIGKQQKIIKGSQWLSFDYTDPETGEITTIKQNGRNAMRKYLLENKEICKWIQQQM